MLAPLGLETAVQLSMVCAVLHAWCSSQEVEGELVNPQPDSTYGYGGSSSQQFKMPKRR